jgi:DNA-binding response OmpR family regulator
MIRIFVVEDDIDLNRFVSSSLRNVGYDVVSCFDGLEAIEKMDEEKCDLLLTDIMMPRMNGFELAESVRATDKTMPIIFMTSSILLKLIMYHSIQVMKINICLLYLATTKKKVR